jgi:hypothetical protein
MKPVFNHHKRKLLSIALSISCLLTLGEQAYSQSSNVNEGTVYTGGPHLPHPNAYRTPPGMPQLAALGTYHDPTLIYPTYRVQFQLSRVRPENFNPRDFFYNPVRFSNEGPEHDRLLAENPCADVSLRSAMVAFQTPRVRRTLRAISCLVEPLMYVEFIGYVPASYGQSLRLNFYKEFGENFDVTVPGFREKMDALVKNQEVTLDNGSTATCNVMDSSALESLMDSVAATVLNTAHSYGRGRALGIDRRIPPGVTRTYRPSVGTAWSAAQISCYNRASNASLDLFRTTDVVVPPRRNQ